MCETEITTYKVKLVKEGNQVYNIETNTVNSSDKAYYILKEVFDTDSMTQENLMLLALNTKFKIIATFTVSTGTINASMADPRDIFQRALLSNATYIIVAHNHPSMDPTPSEEDKSITKRLVKAGKVIGIKVLDHIILGDKDYYSFKRESSIIL